MDSKDANLKLIPKLREKFNCDVGYSGHEVGLVISVAAVTLGATSVERHITLDRAMYGSDQAASIEIDGFSRLVRYIRAVEVALGDGEKKILPAEEENKKKLRYFT
jgi:N-acetylneuraminate synthase